MEIIKDEYSTSNPDDYDYEIIYNKKTRNIYKLNELFKEKKKPEILIEFIYKKIFILLTEKYHIDQNLYVMLYKNYSNYYHEVIFDQKEDWLVTVFPNPRIDFCRYFSFENFFKGLVGRIHFGSKDLGTSMVSFNY